MKAIAVKKPTSKVIALWSCGNKFELEHAPSKNCRHCGGKGRKVPHEGIPKPCECVGEAKYLGRWPSADACTEAAEA